MAEIPVEGREEALGKWLPKCYVDAGAATATGGHSPVEIRNVIRCCIHLIGYGEELQI